MLASRGASTKCTKSHEGITLNFSGVSHGAAQRHGRKDFSSSSPSFEDEDDCEQRAEAFSMNGVGATKPILTQF